MSKAQKSFMKDLARSKRAEGRYLEWQRKQLRKGTRKYKREVAGNSIGLLGGIFLFMCAVSVLGKLQGDSSGGETMFFGSFLEMLRNVPTIDMSWAYFKDDWLSGWDVNVLPGLRSFIAGLIGILQVGALVCGGMAQTAVYAFYFLQWIF